jgi:hypothetical protein
MYILNVTVPNLTFPGDKDLLTPVSVTGFCFIQLTRHLICDEHLVTSRFRWHLHTFFAHVCNATVL